MEIKLDNKDSLMVVFASPVLGAAIILLAVWVGHLITRSQPPMPVTISAAPPRIDVLVPQAAAPRVEVTATAAQPNVEVHVPPSVVNFTPPPPLVTIINHEPDKKEPLPPISPTTNPSHSEAAPAPSPVQVVAKPEQVVFRTEDLTLGTLYQYAEKYIDSYCTKNHLDARAEAIRWNRSWQSQLDTALADGSANDEQAFMNRIIVNKRDCLDLERATPEKIVEGCRLMLRYRDGNLTLLQALQDQVTGENLRKGLVFLAAGVK